MNCRVILLAGWLFTWSAQGMASGILKLSSTELRFGPDEPIGELYALNVGDTPLYLDIEQALVLHPGETHEALVPLNEVSEPSLLVSPSKLVLAPGQKYRMTVKVLNPPTRNNIWRLTFRPRENLIMQPGEIEGQSAPLSVSIGYGVVIYQRASNPASYLSRSST